MSGRANTSSADVVPLFAGVTFCPVRSARWRRRRSNRGSVSRPLPFRMSSEIHRKPSVADSGRGLSGRICRVPSGRFGDAAVRPAAPVSCRNGGCRRRGGRFRRRASLPLHNRRRAGRAVGRGGIGGYRHKLQCSKWRKGARKWSVSCRCFSVRCTGERECCTGAKKFLWREGRGVACCVQSYPVAATCGRTRQERLVGCIRIGSCRRLNAERLAAGRSGKSRTADFAGPWTEAGEEWRRNYR